MTFRSNTKRVILARDVSKRIVADLLMTAGAGADSEDGDSPSIVRMQNDLLDDTF